MTANTVMDWQPIETAPKDGTEFIALSARREVGLASWYNNPFGHKDTVINMRTGRWWTATHWMPFNPPKDATP